MISAFLSRKPTNSYFHGTVPQQNFSYHIQWGNMRTTHPTENSVIAFKARIAKKKNHGNRQCSHLPLTQKQKKFIYSVTRATSLSLQIKIFNYFPIRSRSNYGSPFGRASTHKSQEFRHLGQIRCFISKYWNQASRTDTSFSSECVQNEAGGEEMGGTRKVWHKKKTRDPRSYSDSLTRHQHRPKERRLSHLFE